RTGAWLAAFDLVVGAYVVSHADRLGRRVATAVGSVEKAQRMSATLAAGAATAALVGIVSFTSDSAMQGKLPPAATARLIPHTRVDAPPLAPSGPLTVGPSGTQPGGRLSPGRFGAHAWSQGSFPT